MWNEVAICAINKLWWDEMGVRESEWLCPGVFYIGGGGREMVAVERG